MVCKCGRELETITSCPELMVDPDEQSLVCFPWQTRFYPPVDLEAIHARYKAEWFEGPARKEVPTNLTVIVCADCGDTARVLSTNTDSLCNRCRCRRRDKKRTAGVGWAPPHKWTDQELKKLKRLIYKHRRPDMTVDSKAITAAMHMSYNVVYDKIKAEFSHLVRRRTYIKGVSG